MRTTARPVAALCALVLVAAACSRDGDPLGEPTRLIAEPVEATAPDPGPTASPDASPSPTESPTEEETGERDPTDTDRARFVADYRPGGTSDLRDVSVDLDGDDVKEIVFAYVVDSERRTRVDVADWRDNRYEISAQRSGGPADDLVDVRIHDVNADGRLEVVTLQRVGSSSESLSLWAGVENGGLEPLQARGGCFSGGNTYGDSEASMRDSDGDGAEEIRAVCEEAELPQPLWPTDVYVWSDGAYRCEFREREGGTREPCR
ncbi:MAG: FG-GAP repeat domain-containing protein [Nitriliruptorales bacterium]